MVLKRLLVGISIVFVSIWSSMAQVPAPLSLGRGGGGEALSLAQLRDSALQNNIAIRRAHHEMEAAKEQRREAFTNYFPSVSATGLWFNANRDMAKMEIDPSEYITPELGQALAQSLPVEALMALQSPMTITMMKDGVLAGVTALQPLFMGGQIVIGNKLARIGEKASELQLQLSEHEVEAQVEQYYWQLVSMEQKTRTLDAVDALLANLSNDVSAAVEAGVAMRNDLLQVQLRQNEIASQRLKLNNGRSLVRMLLVQCCGLTTEPDHFSVVVPDIDTAATTLIPYADQNASVVLLPEYQLLEKNVEATTLQRKMEVGKHLPSLAVGAGYTYHNLLDNDRHFAMVFATVSVPITDWWGGSHAIRRKRIAEQQAKEQLDDNTALLKIRMQKAWNDVQEAQSQLALAQNSIGQAEENLRIQRNTYRAGTSTMSDLLQAQLLQQQALDQRTDAFIALQNAHLAYRQATGQ